MRNEELKQEAENYAKENGSCFSHEYGIRIRTYMDCAELREKQITMLEQKNEQLKAQIEKLKCCGNCKNCVFKYDDEDLIFECTITGTENYTHLKTCTNWELAE